VKLHSVEAIAGYVFGADQPSCLRPLQMAFAEPLGKQLEVSEFGVQPNGDRPVWLFKTGSVKLSDTRRVLLLQAIGNANEVTVRVSGDTSDAVDVLHHVWELLHPDEDVPALRDVPGTMAHVTNAVVTLSESCTKLIPILATIQDAIHSNLGSQLVEAPEGDLKFRLDVPIRVTIGGIMRDRSIVIEPRFTATSADRVYFTSSPFTSVQHLAMLEKIEELASTR